MSATLFSKTPFRKAGFSKVTYTKTAFSPTAYLKRIGYHGPLAPDISTLRALHRAHVQAVPFENVDVLLGRPIVLDEARLFDKIVNRRRGGFCYELNGLFAALLIELGFKVHRLAARMSDGAGGFGPDFDHLTLMVELNERWLADVSLADSLREPIRLDERGEQTLPNWRCRIVTGGDGLVLLQAGDGEWQPRFTFTLQTHELGDFAGGCHRSQTSPDSLFTQRSLCYRATPAGRITLSDRKLVLTRNGFRQERLLESDCEVYSVLRDHFGIDLQEERRIQVR